MALLNTTCTYAIRAALQVAIERPEPGTFVSTRHIAETLHVPFAFLTKVLQGLTQSGLLVSQRGAAGGVALARSAHTITLMDILVAVGSDGIFRECVLGLPSCSDATPCALHHQWREERARLETIFFRTSLAELANAGASLPFPMDQPEPASGATGRGKSSRRPR